MPQNRACRKASYHASSTLYLILPGETKCTLSQQHELTSESALTELGEAEAVELSQRLQGIPFTHVFTSPLTSALQTCHLAALHPKPDIEPDLRECGDNHHHNHAAGAIHHPSAPRRNPSPNRPSEGETILQASWRADHLIKRIRKLKTNIALFTHSHFGRVLAMRWLGLPVKEGRSYLLDAASVSILGYDHRLPGLPVILRWNSRALARPVTHPPFSLALQTWENEGGELPQH